MNKICLIYNYAQHYRLGIFKFLDSELDVDFYFGDKMGDVKKIDYSELNNFKRELVNVKIFSSIYYQRGISKILKKRYNNYIVLGEYYCLSTWLILLYTFFTDKKVYLWTHGWYGNEGKLKEIIKKIFFNLSDGVFLYGNYAKQLMVNHGINSSKLHVLYNSLDYEKQLKIRSNLNDSNIFRKKFGNDNPTLIFIGRLTVVKKLDMLIRALSRLNSVGEKYNLVFVGDGEQKTKLLNFVDQYGLNNYVWFYGKSYNEEEIGNLIHNSDLCVSPGNVGLTAMHSLVYGTPVLTHNNFKNQMPEFEAIEEGLTGGFFQEDQVDSLVDVIRGWDFKKDRAIVRENCYNKIDTYYNPLYQLKIIKNAISDKG